MEVLKSLCGGGGGWVVVGGGVESEFSDRLWPRPIQTSFYISSCHILS